MAWAPAVLQIVDQPLMAFVAEAACSQASMGAQSLANLARAAGKLRVEQPALLEVIGPGTPLTIVWKRGQSRGFRAPLALLAEISGDFERRAESPTCQAAFAAGCSQPGLGRCRAGLSEASLDGGAGLTCHGDHDGAAGDVADAMGHGEPLSMRPRGLPLAAAGPCRKAFELAAAGGHGVGVWQDAVAAAGRGLHMPRGVHGAGRGHQGVRPRHLAAPRRELLRGRGGEGHGAQAEQPERVQLGHSAGSLSDLSFSVIPCHSPSKHHTFGILWVS